MFPERLVQLRICLRSRLNESEQPVCNQITNGIPEDVIGRRLAVIPDRQCRQEVRDSDSCFIPFHLGFIEEGIDETEPEHLCRPSGEDSPGEVRCDFRQLPIDRSPELFGLPVAGQFSPCSRSLQSARKAQKERFDDVRGRPLA